MNPATEIMFKHALQIAESVSAKGIMVYSETFDNLNDVIELADKWKVFFVTRTQHETDRVEEHTRHYIRIPNVDLTRNRQVKMALMIGCAHDVFKPEDLLVCLVGPLGSRRLDTIMAVSAKEEYEMFGTADVEKLTEATKNEVFDRIVTLASKLALEGREGKAIGATFILGDYDEVLKHTRQMIINPFKGYPAKSRNILDPNLMETIREFSSLDGAFIVKGNGTIASVGTYLNVECSVDLPPGLGARHASAASITKCTNALAIVISQSTNTVTIFKDGKLVMDIEKPKYITKE